MNIFSNRSILLRIEKYITWKRSIWWP